MLGDTRVPHLTEDVQGLVLPGRRERIHQSPAEGVLASVAGQLKGGRIGVQNPEVVVGGVVQSETDGEAVEHSGKQLEGGVLPAYSAHEPAEAAEIDPRFQEFVL
jgi:hypothetical protein